MEKSRETEKIKKIKIFKNEFLIHFFKKKENEKKEEEENKERKEVERNFSRHMMHEIILSSTPQRYGSMYGEEHPEDWRSHPLLLRWTSRQGRDGWESSEKEGVCVGCFAL